MYQTNLEVLGVEALEGDLVAVAPVGGQGGVLGEGQGDALVAVQEAEDEAEDP